MQGPTKYGGYTARWLGGKVAGWLGGWVAGWLGGQSPPHPLPLPPQDQNRPKERVQYILLHKPTRPSVLGNSVSEVHPLLGPKSTLLREFICREMVRCQRP